MRSVLLGVVFYNRLFAFLSSATSSTLKPAIRYADTQYSLFNFSYVSRARRLTLDYGSSLAFRCTFFTRIPEFLLGHTIHHIYWAANTDSSSLFLFTFHEFSMLRASRVYSIAEA